MDRKTFDTVTTITALILLPLVAVAVHAYLTGSIAFREYVDMWREPLALLLGFWFRGMVSQKGEG